MIGNVITFFVPRQLRRDLTNEIPIFCTYSNDNETWVKCKLNSACTCCLSSEFQGIFELLGYIWADLDLFEIAKVSTNRLDIGHLDNVDWLTARCDKKVEIIGWEKSGKWIVLPSNFPLLWKINNKPCYPSKIYSFLIEFSEAIPESFPISNSSCTISNSDNNTLTCFIYLIIPTFLAHHMVLSCHNNDKRKENRYAIRRVPRSSSKLVCLR